MAHTHTFLDLKFLFVFVAILCLLSGNNNVLVEGGHVTVRDKEYLLLENEGTIKTIQGDDGDVIDCVHIHKQPTYNHSLVKTIHMRPSSYPIGTTHRSSQSEITQKWHKNGKCPKGTVPIRRTPKGPKRDFRHRAFSTTSSGKEVNQSLPQVGAGSFPHEYAAAQVINNEKFYGGHASINVWNPKTEIEEEFSLSQIWLVSETPQGANTMEAGWMVYPQRYHDYQTRFFIYWTSDGYHSTGCYDVCPGFVQTNQEFAIGSALSVSSYDGEPSDFTITIFKDKQTGNWWLQVQGTIIGYWPGSLFTGFAEGAEKLEFGGEIINGRTQGRHTTTQMGSGRFPSEGYRRTSYFRDIKFVDSSNTLRNPQQVAQYVVTNPQCYDIRIEDASSSGSGINFYYGGVGFSANCP